MSETHGTRIPNAALDMIFADLEKGISARVACEAQGVDHTTFSKACSRSPFLQQQRARSRRNLCARLLDQADNPEMHPQAAMFKLERMFPDDFKKPVDSQVLVQNNLSQGESEDECLARAARIAAQRALTGSVPVQIVRDVEDPR